MFLLLLVGCADKAVEPVLTDDDRLNLRLIGIWTKEYYKIQFRVDGSFADSSIQWYPTDGFDTLTITRTGRYSITNSILQFYDVQHTLQDSKNDRGIASQSMALEISISNNQLVGRPVEIFTHVAGSPTELWGQWTTTQWSFFGYVSQTAYEGPVRDDLSLIQDSSYLIRTRTYLKSTTFPNWAYESHVIYSHPNLRIGFNAFDSVTVSFAHNKMYWYYPYEPARWQKLQ